MLLPAGAHVLLSGSNTGAQKDPSLSLVQHVVDSLIYKPLSSHMFVRFELRLNVMGFMQACP